MDHKEKKLNWKKFYIVLLLVLAAVALSSFFTVKEHVYNPAQEDTMKQIWPASYMEKEDGNSEYSFEFTHLTASTRTLLFFTNHQEVRVYMNNVMIYANTKVDSPFGHTTGATWNQVELPEMTGNVRILIRPVYPEVKQTNVTFFQGNGVAMGYSILRKSLLPALMCMAIIVIGICMLCFWAFLGMHKRWPEDVLYLGILFLFMGVWSLGETQGAIYSVHNRIAASYIAYTCLMAIGILFVMFTHRFMHLHDRVLYRGLLIYGLAETLICELLQFFDIRDMKQTVLLTHIMIIGSVVYMLYGICVNLHRHCYLMRSAVNCIGFVVLLITMALDMYTYYDNRVNANQAGKFGVLIYFLIVGFETLRETRQHLDEENHLQMYREMAMKDMLTGCFTRNAYDEQLERENDIKWSQIVTFDLNNLKMCNDTYGHQAGDKYLCDSASIIRNVYGRFGKVYRIGGDEFCVITRGLSEKRMGDLQLKLQQVEREYNQRRPQVKMEIACGYASYDENCDKTIEDIRLRADVRMYENKKELKGKSDRIRRVL